MFNDEGGKWLSGEVVADVILLRFRQCLGTSFLPITGRNPVLESLGLPTFIGTLDIVR